MLSAELKRRKKLLLPLALISGIIVLVFFTNYNYSFTTSSHPVLSSSHKSNNAFPTLDQTSSTKARPNPGNLIANQNDKSTTGTYFTKFIHKDPQFDFTKITYISTNKKFKTNNIKVDEETGDTTEVVNKPTVLIMSVIGNNEPYGSDRHFDGFMLTILSLVENQPDYEFSLGLLNNNEEEFIKIQNYFEKNLQKELSETLSSIFKSISLISAPFLDQNTGFSREQRHDDHVQRLRRRLIAKSRNFLLLNTLNLEQYVLSLDADMIRFDNPEKFIKAFIESKKDIIVPRIQRLDMQDYDKNSWRGQRTKPTKEQLEKMDNNQWDQWDYVPRDVKDHMYHFQTYMDNKDNEYELHKEEYDYVVPLDSVGGAVLFAKSIVFKQGVIFPTSLIVGTTWDRQEGYDGIETEGVCYLAKPLGFSCWGMPNVVAHHSGG